MTEQTEKTEDELLLEMMAEEDAAALEQELAAEDELEGETEDGPRQPTADEIPPVPVAPAALDPAAVETTPSGLKFGWQQPRVRGIEAVDDCFHMALVQARNQVQFQDVGHEWVCTCGAIFDVVMNAGGKKTLKKREVAVK